MQLCDRSVRPGPDAFLSHFCWQVASLGGLQGHGFIANSFQALPEPHSKLSIICLRDDNLFDYLICKPGHIARKSNLEKCCLSDGHHCTSKHHFDCGEFNNTKSFITVNDISLIIECFWPCQFTILKAVEIQTLQKIYATACLNREQNASQLAPCFQSKLSFKK